jgi:hypothetical protein
MKWLRRILLYPFFRRIMRKYRGTLPETTTTLDPKMEYYAMADAVIWEDEGLIECHPDLGNAFRFVVHHRTELITGVTTFNKEYKKYFDLAKKYYPNWIGFDPSRCSFNVERADRITRLRKVSQWKIDKMMEEIETENH